MNDRPYVASSFLSVALSQIFGTALSGTNEIMRDLLASSLKTATVDQKGWHDSGKGPGSTEGNYINWMTFSDNAKSVVEERRPLLGFTDVMHVPTWIERFNEGLDVVDERLKQLAPDGLPIWQD